jgi:ParB/RepB/Spo0J family partition protein
MSVDTGTTAVVALDQIEVDPAENPRGEIDVRTLGELIASIEQHGVLQPVLVEPQNEHYKLVAGYRRFLGAAAAELGEIPVLIRDAGESRATYALSENLPGIRENMDPVAEAKAMERIANAEGLNRKKLAKRLGKSESFVRERLRLIRLPEGVQDAIAVGTVPVSAAAELEQIAKVSDRLAGLVVETIARQEIDAGDLIEAPGRAISLALSVALSDDARLTPGSLPALALGYGAQVEIEGDLPEGEQRDALMARYEQLGIESHYGGYVVRLREEDIDALRALGVLLEFEHEYTAYRFVCSSEALADRLRLVLDATEKELAKEERARKRRDAVERKQAAEAAGVDPSEVDPEELARAERKAEREEREAEKRQARSNNEELGHRLVRRRGQGLGEAPDRARQGGRSPGGRGQRRSARGGPPAGPGGLEGGRRAHPQGRFARAGEGDLRCPR